MKLVLVAVLLLCATTASINGQQINMKYTGPKEFEYGKNATMTWIPSGIQTVTFTLRVYVKHPKWHDRRWLIRCYFANGIILIIRNSENDIDDLNNRVILDETELKDEKCVLTLQNVTSTDNTYTFDCQRNGFKTSEPYKFRYFKMPTRVSIETIHFAPKLISEDSKDTSGFHTRCVVEGLDSYREDLIINFVGDISGVEYAEWITRYNTVSQTHSQYLKPTLKHSGERLFCRASFKNKIIKSDNVTPLVLVNNPLAKGRNMDTRLTYVGPQMFEIGKDATLTWKFDQSENSEFKATLKVKSLQYHSPMKTVAVFKSINSRVTEGYKPDKIKSNRESTRVPEVIQAYKFKDRIVLHKDEFAAGRITITLKNVTMDDMKKLFRCELKIKGDSRNNVSNEYQFQVYNKPKVNMDIKYIIPDGDSRDISGFVATCRVENMYRVPYDVKFVGDSTGIPFRGKTSIQLADDGHLLISQIFIPNWKYKDDHYSCYVTTPDNTSIIKSEKSTPSVLIKFNMQTIDMTQYGEDKLTSVRAVTGSHLELQCEYDNHVPGVITWQYTHNGNVISTTSNLLVITETSPIYGKISCTRSFVDLKIPAIKHQIELKYCHLKLTAEKQHQRGYSYLNVKCEPISCPSDLKVKMYSAQKNKFQVLARNETQTPQWRSKVGAMNVDAKFTCVGTEKGWKTDERSFVVKSVVFNSERSTGDGVVSPWKWVPWIVFAAVVVVTISSYKIIRYECDKKKQTTHSLHY